MTRRMMMLVMVTMRLDVMVVMFIMVICLGMVTTISLPVPGGPWRRATLLSPTCLESTCILARVRLTVMAANRSFFTVVEKIRLSLEEKVGGRRRRGAARGTRGAGGS